MSFLINQRTALLEEMAMAAALVEIMECVHCKDDRIRLAWAYLSTFGMRACAAERFREFLKLHQRGQESEAMRHRGIAVKLNADHVDSLKSVLGSSATPESAARWITRMHDHDETEQDLRAVAPLATRVILGDPDD